MAISLDKMSDKVRLSLSKKTTKTIPNDINVTLALDVSGSNQWNFANGNITDLVQRILGISNVIDDDGILNFYLFDTSVYPQASIVAKEQYDTVSNLIREINNSRKYWGGTYFAPTLNKINQDLLGGTKSGFFGKLSRKAASNAKQLILFITDGDNSDRRDTSDIIAKLRSVSNVYIQFVDVGNSNSYLQELANKEDFIGYSQLRTFSESDEVVIDALINTELLTKFGV